MNILKSQASQVDAYKAQNAKLQIIAATLKQQLGNLQQDIVNLQTIKNQYVILEQENQELKSNIDQLRDQADNSQKCQNKLEDVQDNYRKLKNDNEILKADFESLTVRSTTVRNELDQCQNQFTLI